MERLTMTSAKGGVAFTFDLDITCEPSEARKILKLAEKLKEYEDAEEQGLLLKLPCKVGDNVYKIWSCGKNGKSVAEFRISHIDIDDLQNIEFAFISTKNISTSYWFCKIGDFGKTVFLTKEEAEQALKQMGE